MCLPTTVWICDTTLEDWRASIWDTFALWFTKMPEQLHQHSPQLLSIMISKNFYILYAIWLSQYFLELSIYKTKKINFYIFFLRFISIKIFLNEDAQYWIALWQTRLAQMLKKVEQLIFRWVIQLIKNTFIFLKLYFCFLFVDNLSI